MLVILFAGFSKIVGIGLFYDSLKTWQLLPKWSATPIALAVPLAEILFAAMWFLNICRAWVVLGVSLLLFVITAGFALHLAIGISEL